MESSQSLNMVEVFRGYDVRIVGTHDEPRFNCSDVMLKVLGYTNYSDCRPFRKLQNNTKYVVVQDVGVLPISSGSHRTQRFFTKRGVFELLCRSEQQVAEEFKDWVYAILDNLQQGKIQIISRQLEEQQRQIEEQKQTIEELKQPTPATIYVLKHRNTGNILYVGKDTSKQQNRIQQHITERRKIVSQYQLIDIYLATIPEQEIDQQIFLYNSNEVDQQERDAIQQLNPLYNQAMNNRSNYVCYLCDKVYKNRGCYEKHLLIHQEPPAL